VLAPDPELKAPAEARKTATAQTIRRPLTDSAYDAATISQVTGANSRFELASLLEDDPLVVLGVVVCLGPLADETTDVIVGNELADIGRLFVPDTARFGSRKPFVMKGSPVQVRASACEPPVTCRAPPAGL
jgi:hypothetical protein